MRPLLLLALCAAPAALVGCGKRSDPADAPGAGTVTDKERLQGSWAVEALEFGDPKRTPRGDGTAGRLHFQGDRLVVAIDLVDEYAFALDESKEPKALLLTRLDRATGQPYRDVTKRAGAPDLFGEVRKEEWIYKFDGDQLVLALVRLGSREAAVRPTEFKATEEPRDVLVVRLKKTDEAVPPPRPKATQPTPRPGTRK